VDWSSKGQESFICREEKGKAAWGHTEGPGNQWSPRSGWKLGFITFLLPEGRDFGGNGCLLGRRGVSLAQTGVSWEEEGAFFLLANSYLLGTQRPPAVCLS
jgi:hypothetical protein